MICIERRAIQGRAGKTFKRTIGEYRAFFDGRGGRVGLWTVAAGAAVLDDVRGGTIG